MFRVGISRDLRATDTSSSWGDIGLAELDAAGACWEFLPEDGGELTSAHVAGFDAVIFAAPAVTAATVSGPNPPRILARFGVGLDAVDLAACTKAGVAVTITPDGAARAVATAALTLMLAAGHRLLAKDRLVRDCRWADKISLMGRGLSGRSVGTIGFGNVATELFTLLKPFGTVNFTADPYRVPEQTAAHGVTLTALDDLLRRCEYVVVTAALTTGTRELLDAGKIALLRECAVVVNVARGPIIETNALAEALAANRIFAAGLDVVDPEPLPPGHPLLGLPNVVLSPHALAWTDEMAIGNGRSAVGSVLAVKDGRRPANLANPDVLRGDRYREGTR
jgi:phosphoglycerate dehydrogenase-like enzyme